MFLPFIFAQAAATPPKLDTPPPPQSDAAQTASSPGRLGQSLVPPASDAFGDDALKLPRVPEDPSPSVISRRRGVTVAERSHPEYDPIGIPLGALRAFPEFGAHVGVDSNVYRQQSGASDIFGQLRAAAVVRSDFSRHAVILDGNVEQSLYGKYTTENALTYDAHALSRLDVDRSASLTAEVRRSHSIVDRGAAGEVLQTREPIRFDVTQSSLAARKAFNRITVDVAALVSYANYKDTETPALVPVDQDFRDFNLYQLHGEVGYGLPSGREVFMSVTGEARRFRNFAPPINRDADSIEVLGGLRSDITPLLRGRLGIGYLFANFKDPTIKSRSGLGIDVRLDYLYSELTTFNLSARRALQNVASTTAPAALVTEVRVGVDHEYRRNIILSAGLGVQNADYINTRGSALRYTADAGARWSINRQFRIDGSVGYRRRDSSALSSNRDYDEVRATVGVTYRL